MTGGDGATGEAVICMACGRLLSDQESKRLRLGPRCRKRLQGLLAPGPRRTRTQTAPPHPKAVPVRAAQLAFEIWDDDEDLNEDEWIDDIGYTPPDRDLWGQGLTARQINTLTDTPVTGSYL